MEISYSQIRDDLKNIRYYYGRKDSFDNLVRTLGEHSIVKVAEKYNEAIKNAPPRLYDLYISLYLNNHTQESLAEEWCFCIEHMSRMNCQLVKFFKTQFEKEEQ